MPQKGETTAKTLLLTSLSDHGNSESESKKTEERGVDTTYADATDGYPALNTMSGVLTAKRTRKVIKSIPDAYSTTSDFHKHALDPVKVGLDTTIPYMELDLDMEKMTDETSLSGKKVGSLAKFGILTEVTHLHSDKSLSASTTMAEFGPGG